MPSDAKKKQMQKKKEAAKARSAGKKPTTGSNPTAKEDVKDESPSREKVQQNGTSNGSAAISEEGKSSVLLLHQSSASFFKLTSLILLTKNKRTVCKRLVKNQKYLLQDSNIIQNY